MTIPRDKWPDTRVSLLHRINESPDTVSRNAALMEWLNEYETRLRDYARACARKFFPYSPGRWTNDDADQLVKDFFSDKIVIGNLLQKWDPHRGAPFHAYLKSSFRNYILDRLPSASEGREADLGDFNMEDVPSRYADPIDVLLDLPAIQSCLDHAWHQMERDCRAEGNLTLWRAFYYLLLRPTLENTRRPTYAELGEYCGIRDDPEAKKIAGVVARAKKRFVKTLRQALAASFACDGRQASVAVEESLQLLQHELIQKLICVQYRGQDLSVSQPGCETNAFSEMLDLKIDTESHAEETPLELLESLLDARFEDLFGNGACSTDTVRSLRIALLAPDTSLQQLRRLKKIAKGIVRRATRSENPNLEKAADTIYIATIGAAVAHHAAKPADISTKSGDALYHDFCVALERPWLPTDIAELLRTARDALQSSRTKTGESEP